jgi:hypothetical protein
VRHQPPAHGLSSRQADDSHPVYSSRGTTLGCSAPLRGWRTPAECPIHAIGALPRGTVGSGTAQRPPDRFDRSPDDYDGLPSASVFGPITATARTPMCEAAERVVRGLKRCSSCKAERAWRSSTPTRARETVTARSAESARGRGRRRPTASVCGLCERASEQRRPSASEWVRPPASRLARSQALCRGRWSYGVCAGVVGSPWWRLARR